MRRSALKCHDCTRLADRSDATVLQPAALLIPSIVGLLCSSSITLCPHSPPFPGKLAARPMAYEMNLRPVPHTPSLHGVGPQVTQVVGSTNIFKMVGGWAGGVSKVLCVFYFVKHFKKMND